MYNIKAFCIYFEVGSNGVVATFYVRFLEMRNDGISSAHIDISIDGLFSLGIQQNGDTLCRKISCVSCDESYAQ